MATRHPVEMADPLPQIITTGLTKIHLALRSRGLRSSGNRNFAPAQGQILTFLRSRPYWPPTVSDIAANFTVTPGSASLAIRGLTESGLVKKSRSGKDARCVTLALTAKGRRRADRTVRWSDFLSRAAETLTVQEQETLLRALVKILMVLQERGEIPAARMCPTCRHFRPNVPGHSTQPHYCAALDTSFGDGQLRIDCPAHDPAVPEARMSIRRTLISGARLRSQSRE